MKLKIQYCLFLLFVLGCVSCTKEEVLPEDAKSVPSSIAFDAAHGMHQSSNYPPFVGCLELHQVLMDTSNDPFPAPHQPPGEIIVQGRSDSVAVKAVLTPGYWKMYQMEVTYASQPSLLCSTPATVLTFTPAVHEGEVRFSRIPGGTGVVRVRVVAFKWNLLYTAHAWSGFLEGFNQFNPNNCLERYLLINWGCC